MRRPAHAASLAVVTVVLVVPLAACGEARVNAEDDLCVQYDQLVDRVDELAELDPDTTTVDELRAEAEDVQDQLDAVQAVAEGRLDTLISRLRSAVDDLVVSVADAGQDALDTARPLVEDTLDDVSEAWATLQQVANVRCEEAG